MKRRCFTSTTRCNHCALAEYRRLAQETNRMVTLKPKPLAKFPNGHDVFIHPAAISDRGLAQCWAGWLGSVPENCEC